MTAALRREPRRDRWGRLGRMDGAPTIADDDLAACPLRRRRGVRASRGAVAPGAARPLLPDARLRPRRRRRAAGRAGARRGGGSAGFEGRSSLRSWLYTVATRTCLDVVAARGRRALPDRPRARPASRAGPRRRAGHRDRLARPLPRRGRAGAAPRSRSARPSSSPSSRPCSTCRATSARPCCSSRCSASRPRRSPTMMATTTASVNSRAAAGPPARRRAGSRPSASSARCAQLDDARLREIVDGLRPALERGDADALVALLTEDVTWSMPPLAALVPRARRRHRRSPRAVPLGDCGSWRHAPGRRERPARRRALPRRTRHPARRRAGAPPGVVVHRADPARRGDRVADVVPRPGGLPCSRTADRARPVNHPSRPRGHLRKIRDWWGPRGGARDG